MTPVRQLPFHCAIACLVSAEEDLKLDTRQREIVKLFPKECSAGTAEEGMIPTVGDFTRLVVGLKLADDVEWIMDADKIRPALEALLPNGDNVFIKTTAPMNHFVRAMSVTTTGVLVMNPAVGYDYWDWKRIEDSKCLLAVFVYK